MRKEKPLHMKSNILPTTTYVSHIINSFLKLFTQLLYNVKCYFVGKLQPLILLNECILVSFLYHGGEKKTFWHVILFFSVFIVVGFVVTWFTFNMRIFLLLYLIGTHYFNCSLKMNHLFHLNKVRGIWQI